MTPVSTTGLDELAAEISGDVLADDLSRAMYSTAAGVYQILPLGVVRPRDRDDIRTTLAWCRANDVAVTLRGGGTSPVDGCLGKGIILDTSAYLGREPEIEVHEETVTAPAGATYATINAALRRFDRYLPPGPATGDCCTIGGLIAVNASGMTSLRYGPITESVASLEIVLADGTVMETRPVDMRGSRNGAAGTLAGNGREAGLYHEVYHLLRDQRGLIRSKVPDLPANSSGYRVEQALRRGLLDLGKLIAGSEGTLAVITQATLRTVEPAPIHGALILYFEDLQLAADSVRPILDAGPCSLELIDARALDLLRTSRPDLGHFFRNGMQSVLVAEFDGADNDEIIPKLIETQKLLAEEGGTAADSVLLTADADVEEARSLRQAARNILHNVGGARSVTPFIEDIGVGADMISSCVHGLGEIMKKHDLDVVVNGHIGQGNLCARPLLDLKDAEDIRTMREAAEEVFAMVCEMGGTISGSHGDGLARSEFLRLQYGEVCDVFAEVKRIFDPGGVLNPGVKVDAERGTLVSDLRYGAEYSRRDVQPKLLYHGAGRGDVIEACHGCGACRSLSDDAAMCPVYRALKTEEASPRAKANILRHVLSNRGALPPEDEVVAEMTRLTDLCVNCKMCSVECPAGIDVAKLMVELRARRAEKGGLTGDEKFAKVWNTVLSVLAKAPPVGDFLLQNPIPRFLAEKTLGFSARRELPRFRTLKRSGRHRPTLTKTRERVVYFTGTYTDCCQPEVLQCALDVLLRNGTEVEVIGKADSGKTRMMYGDIVGARKLIEKNVKRIAPLVEEGFRVVFTEPRTALFFKKEMLDCIDTPETRSVAGASFDLMQFLLSLHRAGRFDTRFRAVPVPLAYHAPCHLRALGIGTPALELLRLIPDLPVAELGGGCCGMAGTFGLRARNHELSMRIGRPLFEQLKTLEVRYVLTDCTYCGIQFLEGSGKRPLHPVQVLHRAYGLPEQGMEAW